MYFNEDPARDWDIYESNASRNGVTCPKCHNPLYDESELYETDYGMRCRECLTDMRKARLDGILKRINKIVGEDIAIMDRAGMFADGDSWDDGWNYIAENLGLKYEE